MFAIVISHLKKPLYIPEGRIKRTQKNQEIDFRMLSSCFTLTATLSDQTFIGAHFAHFGQDAEIDGDTNGKAPKDLIHAFQSALKSVKKERINVASIQVIGHLQLWSPDLLGLSAAGSDLSQSSVQKALFKYLDIASDKTKVIDTSMHSYVRLSISPISVPIFKFAEEEKSNKTKTR